MAYRTLIVDDEKPARDRIRRLLRDHADFEVIGEAADAVEAIRSIETHRPDVVFLDVRMPEGSGFDVLESLETPPRAVFVTAYDAYAVQAFEVESVDYLLKPVNKRRFAAALDRLRRELSTGPADPGALARLLESVRARPVDPTVPDSSEGAEPREPNRISARRGNKIVVLSLEEIGWFEAEETLVFAHTEDARLLVERTLAELEALLPRTFFRCHRRFLVNLGRISEIQPAEAGTYRILLRGDEAPVLPLSRRQARKLREIIPW